jgi:hypothetical protein
MWRWPAHDLLVCRSMARPTCSATVVGDDSGAQRVNGIVREAAALASAYLAARVATIPSSERGALRSTIPSDEAIAAAGDRPGDAWLPQLQALIAARGRARTVIRDATAGERLDP